MTDRDDAQRTLATIFGRLFENEFASLDDIAISCRVPDGLVYLDGVSALSAWLGDEDLGLPIPPNDGAALPLHETLHAASPDHDVVISGLARHLRALLLEGFPAPPATSMLRNRGVSDLAAHLVAPQALAHPALHTTIARAKELARRDGMRHHLIIATDGKVVVSGSPPFEAMAHWHNVEFAARVECLRLEDAARQPADGRRS
jgi:hypothetical protein